MKRRRSREEMRNRSKRRRILNIEY
jgi:hypothetical protein